MLTQSVDLREDLRMWFRLYRQHSDQSEGENTIYVNGIILSCKHIPVSVEELQYSVRIFEAILPSPISWRASATAFHVGSWAFRSHWHNISSLQRSLSPRKSWLIVRSSWSFRPNLTPSGYQSTTESSAFVSSFKRGVAAAVGEEMIRWNLTDSRIHCRRWWHLFLDLGKAELHDTELTFRQSL